MPFHYFDQQTTIQFFTLAIIAEQNERGNIVMEGNGIWIWMMFLTNEMLSIFVV